MQILTSGLVGLIALLHGYFLVLEMFLWTKPFGLKTFGYTLERATDSQTLAANQGLYNGFMAAGLIWGLLNPNPSESRHVLIFFLTCIIVAGAYGGFTAKMSILYIQALPALLTLGLVLAQGAMDKSGS